jgi:hypothetical protein
MKKSRGSLCSERRVQKNWFEKCSLRNPEGWSYDILWDFIHKSVCDFTLAVEFRCRINDCILWWAVASHEYQFNNHQFLKENEKKKSTILIPWLPRKNNSPIKWVQKRRKYKSQHVKTKNTAKNNILELSNYKFIVIKLGSGRDWSVQLIDKWINFLFFLLKLYQFRFF